MSKYVGLFGLFLFSFYSLKRKFSNNEESQAQMMRDIYLILHIVPNECVGIKFDLSNIFTFFSVAIPFNHSQEVINNYKKDI